jgi:hypothetical protein
MPRFLHGLTAIHALGAVACFVMAIGSAISTDKRNARCLSDTPHLPSILGDLAGRF